MKAGFNPDVGAKDTDWSTAAADEGIGINDVRSCGSSLSACRQSVVLADNLFLTFVEEYVDFLNIFEEATTD